MRLPADLVLSIFKTEQVVKAIKQNSNSIAAGPDGLMMLHLKHLGLRDKAFHTHLFILLLQSSDIPSIWKQSNLISIPKAGKPRHLETFYRPISLLYPSIEVLERLILPALKGSLRLADSQHGFCRMKSTTPAMLPLAQKVAACFNRNKPPHRTIAMTIDLSKTSDPVHHSKLKEEINATGLHHNII